MGWQVNQKPFRRLCNGIKQGYNSRQIHDFLRVTLNAGNQSNISLTNEGFRGMGIQKRLMI